MCSEMIAHAKALSFSSNSLVFFASLRENNLLISEQVLCLYLVLIQRQRVRIAGQNSLERLDQPVDLRCGVVEAR